MIKKTLIITTLFLTSFIFFACEAAQNPNDDDQDPKEVEPIKDIDHTIGRIPAPEEHLYDDFQEGLSPDKWLISTRNWSPAVSQGQKADNVGVTEDGILVLEAHGLYHPDPEKQMTGSAILTPETLGPGKYSVAMKVHPRLGVCTAIWTYYYENDSFNHEIDIEFPGSRSLRNLMNTSWVGVAGRDHTNIIVETDTPANDGNWHVYSFEWNTNPNIIRFYVDGVLTSEITENVPFANGQFWIGAWFPNRWAGVPDFETDVFLVDWFSYEPYDQPSIETTPSTSQMANLDQYPTEFINIPSQNMLSNGHFETTNDAWTFEGDVYFTNRPEDPLKRMLSVDDNGLASQVITAVYDEYHFAMQFEGYVFRGSEGMLNVEYLNIDGDVIDTLTYTIDNVEEKLHVLEFVTPMGTEALRISFKSVDGSLFFIDNAILKLQLK